MTAKRPKSSSSSTRRELPTGSASSTPGETSPGSLTSTELPTGRLEERFADKAPLYSPGDARAEADRCLYCFDAPCVHACPTEIDIPKFIKRIATGDIVGSARTILQSNLLGYSCGRVCPVEVLCAGACVYNHLEQPPIQIGRLQRYAVETAFESGRSLLLPMPTRPGKVALVGAGPASLSCAGVLALAGVETVIYEGKSWPGGLNTTGVAPYKMPASDSLMEIEFLCSLGVRIESGVTVGADVDAQTLLGNFDAIFLGLGLGSDRRLGIPGEHGDGVLGAVDFIERLKLESLSAGVPAGAPDRVAKSGAGSERDGTAIRDALAIGGGKTAVGDVLVIGGGNTAIDAARELAQLGAASVCLVYRKSASEMSGYAHEMDAARTEGVRLIDDATPREVIREAGRVIALRIERRRDAGAIESRPSKDPKPLGSESRSLEVLDLSADLIVLAIGQDRLASTAGLFPGVEVDARGRLVVDAYGRTGNPKVYAGGDCTNGGKEVVNAVADGKLAAASILEQLDSPGC